MPRDTSALIIFFSFETSYPNAPYKPLLILLSVRTAFTTAAFSFLLALAAKFRYTVSIRQNPVRPPVSLASRNMAGGDAPHTIRGGMA